jgi:adenine-specific DNA-methyltransferase
VRCLLDEVFGRENFVAVITFKKGMALRSVSLPGVVDYLIWYARSRQDMKYRSLYVLKTPLEDEEYRQVELPSGLHRKLFREEVLEPSFLPEGSRIFATQPLIAAGSNPSCVFPITIAGNRYITEKGWKTNREGMERLLQAERINPLKTSLRYKILLSDYYITTLVI